MEFNTEITNYILNNINPEDLLLQEISRETNAKIMRPRMISGYIQGKLLEMISFMISPKYILEIGTYTGYSALCLAKGLQKNGKIITIEINDELQNFTQSFFNKSENKHKIEFLIGDALEIVPKLEPLFDLIFIDGDKTNYIKYYEQCLLKLRVGGFIIADNTLWSGKVIDETIKSNDYQTKAIIEFNTHIKNDKRIDKIILPIRDGISIFRKL
jgi:predicted O-methyltransferase YrrM